MTVPSVHCEAKKISYRQSRDGLVVSFVIHPSDMPDELALAPLGQRYVLALAAIGDDEEPVPWQPAGAPWYKGHPPDTKVAVRVTASERGKQRYATASDMERALVRAATLPKDARFRAWLGPACPDEVSAANHIRHECCFGESRKLIAEDRECYEAFIRMETSYLIETGVLAEPR